VINAYSQKTIEKALALAGKHFVYPIPLFGPNGSPNRYGRNFSVRNSVVKRRSLRALIGEAKPTGK
jgi:hypothetical protein